MKKIIATTTINDPTSALLKYAAMPDWHVVVAGDIKTNHESFRALKNITYLDPMAQEALSKELSDAIGWKCIERRNMAILKAYMLGADYIALIDDDNVPFDNWAQDLCVGKSTSTNFYTTDEIAFDPIGCFPEYGQLWHRGFPLEMVPDRTYDNVATIDVIPDIQAILWNGEPDVDAVCRMIYRPKCEFSPKKCPIASNKPSPFNSQNIILARHVIPHYFLFPQTERAQDIWASYYVQAKGFKVVYTKPGVYSDRTLGTTGRYSLINDMKKEYLTMEHNKSLIRDLTINPESIHSYLPAAAHKAFEIWKKVIKNL